MDNHRLVVFFGYDALWGEIESDNYCTHGERKMTWYIWCNPCSLAHTNILSNGHCKQFFSFTLMRQNEMCLYGTITEILYIKYSSKLSNIRISSAIRKEYTKNTNAKLIMTLCVQRKMIKMLAFCLESSLLDDLLKLSGTCRWHAYLSRVMAERKSRGSPLTLTIL